MQFLIYSSIHFDILDKLVSLTRRVDALKDTGFKESTRQVQAWTRRVGLPEGNPIL